MECFEDRKDCPPVECFIWDKVVIDFGDFGGIKKMTFTELIALRSLCDHQLQDLTTPSSISTEG